MKSYVQNAIAIAVLISVTFYLSSVLWLGQHQKDYNHFIDLVSELGKREMPYSYVLNSTLVLSGMSLICLAVLLFYRLEESRTRIIGIISLGLFGLSVFFGGTFPCEGDCLHPTTTSGYLHAILGLPAVITAPLAYILIGKSMGSSDQFRVISDLIRWLGWCTALAMIAAMSIFPNLGLVGLGQRVGALFQLAVPLVISIRLLTAADFKRSIGHEGLL